MNKNLEHEYKQHIEDQIPDLWDRIEAALPEKNNSSTKESEDNVVEFSDKKNSNKNNSNKKKFNSKTISIISGLAVAMIAGIMIIPTVMNGIGLKGENMATSARQDSAIADEEVKSDKASKDKKDKKNKSANLDVATATEATDDAYYEADAAPCEEAYEEVACEEATCDEADYDDSVTNELQQNSGYQALSDPSSLDDRYVFCIFTKTDSEGIANVDKDSKLARPIADIINSNSVVASCKDIRKASITPTGNGQCLFELKLKSKGTDRFSEATKQAADNGESLYLYYNGAVISVSVPTVIENGVVDLYYPADAEYLANMLEGVTEYINEHR